jgi:hypothetical protein
MTAFGNEKNKLHGIVIASDRRERGHPSLRAKRGNPTKSLRGAQRRGNLNLFMGDCFALSALAITI